MCVCTFRVNLCREIFSVSVFCHSFCLLAWSVFKELESTLKTNSGSNLMTANEKEKRNSLEFWGKVASGPPKTSKTHVTVF